MLIKGSKRYNLRHNSKNVPPPDFGKMINGQGMGNTANFRYGICHMSFNGCEVIAVHNALVWLGIPKPLSDVAFFMERYRVLMGFFGCNAYQLGKGLEHFGAAYRRTDKVSEAEASNAFIITFWTKKPFLSSIHTVFCVNRSNGIEVYNRYNNRNCTYICKNIEEIAGKRRPIAIYIIRDTEKKEEII